ncbi:MAG: hypothetical protein KF706_06725 [Chitinophagales bacterium]|nr:hypothetical protein [Chitinophagales bacterium]OJV25603.1 MAG: hypothetical protein BGO32_00905 [Bacteroidetes bacterium 37-13]HRP38196.1 hypothetical protein [Chitinophagales bacterium]
MKKLSFLLFIFLLVLIQACKKDSRSNWDTELLTPIASASLSIENIVKDTNLVKKQSDNSLLLSYNKEIYDFGLAKQIINMPDTFIGTVFRLDSLRIANQWIVYKTTLGQMGNMMKASPDPSTQAIGNFIINSHQQMRVIPPINGLSAPPTVFDASDYFQQATLKTGYIDLYIHNDFPIPISNAVVEVKDLKTNTVLLTETLPYVNAHDSTFKLIDIAGKTVSDQLSFQLISLNSPGSNGNQVLVDTNDNFRIDIRFWGMRVQEADAKFPNQDIVSITEEVTQNLGDRKLTYIDCRKGTLKIYITSTVEEQLYLKYVLEGAYDKYGRPLVEATTVPPAPAGGSVTVDREFDISGYSIDLSGKDGTKFNTYTQTIYGRIDSTGQVRHISLDDSLIIRYDLKDIAPNYIKGYAGRDTIVANDSTDFDFFGSLFKSGSIQLKDVDLKFTLDNGMGIDGVVKVNELTAMSPQNGSRTLTGSVLSSPFTVGRATDFPFKSAVTTFDINSNNSNVTDLLNIMPNRLRYNMEIKTNPQGNTGFYRDFAYLESTLKVNLNATIPLSFIANNLTLLDTIDFNLSNTNLKVNGITDGVINIITQNKYPIDAKIKVIVVDENFVTVDTLTSNMFVSAAPTDANCKVTQAQRNKTSVDVNQARIENIKRGRKAILFAEFNTPQNNAACNGKPMQIYSDYKLDVTFTARFNYTVSTKIE